MHYLRAGGASHADTGRCASVTSEEACAPHALRSVVRVEASALRSIVRVEASASCKG
jgi:hypothetical protein